MVEAAQIETNAETSKVEVKSNLVTPEKEENKEKDPIIINVRIWLISWYDGIYSSFYIFIAFH